MAETGLHGRGGPKSGQAVIEPILHFPPTHSSPLLKEETMPSDQSKRLAPDTLGTGVHDPKDFCRFAPDEAFNVAMYADPHLAISIWNLEPGQENAAHIHPTREHVMMVLTGSGIYLRGDEDPVPIQAGQCAIVPVGVVHGIRNTGTDNLSCMIISSTTGVQEYVRQRV